MHGCGAVASWAVMVAVFVCGLCWTSDDVTVVASVLRHQQRSHIGCTGQRTGLYQKPLKGLRWWRGCAKALGSNMCSIHCRVAYSEAALL